MVALRALLVDVGGTLVDDATWLAPDRYNPLRLARLTETLGEQRPWFDAFFEQTFSESNAELHEQRTADQVASFLVAQGVESTQDEIERICRACAPPLGDVVSIEPHARDALEAVHAMGIRMAICSNTLWRDDADARRDWEALGFDHLFEAYVTSNSTGYGKPHPAMFERCLDALGVSADEAAMIGDRPDLDIAGAKPLGIRTIWKRPPWFEGDPDPAPDAEITCLADLPPILETWRR